MKKVTIQDIRDFCKPSKNQIKRISIKSRRAGNTLMLYKISINEALKRPNLKNKRKRKVYFSIKKLKP